MNLGKFLFVGSLVGVTSLSAIDLKDNVTPIGGFQHGRFRQDTNLNFPGVDSTGTFETDVLVTDQVESRVDLAVAGFEARFVVPELSCLSEYAFLSNLYLVGHAIWGWNDGNKFSERAFLNLPTNMSAPDSYENTYFLAKGKLKKARSYDFVIGLGYLFEFGDWQCMPEMFKDWAIGVGGGYSFHKQTLQTKNANSGEFSTCTESAIYVYDDPAYHDTKFHNKWNGGWVGGEILYKTCKWELDLIYQYHIVEFRGINNTSPAGLLSGYQDVSLRTNTAHGNTWKAKLKYYLSTSWSVGTVFTYEYWHAKHGSFRVTAPSGESIESIYGTDKYSTSINASWDSYSIVATLGFDF